MTIGRTTLKKILANEMKLFNAVPVMLKQAVKDGTSIDLTAVQKLPHLHLGESNFKTKIIKNGESCTEYLACCNLTRDKAAFYDLYLSFYSQS